MTRGRLNIAVRLDMAQSTGTRTVKELIDGLRVRLGEIRGEFGRTMRIGLGRGEEEGESRIWRR